MKKEYYFDTIIIGGGPAGAACGIELIKKNQSCCILDKAIFPREKVCGGLLPEKTIGLLADLMSDLSYDFIEKKITLDTCQSLAFYEDSTFLFRTSLETKFIISDRKILDFFLIEYYKNHGGNMEEGISIQTIDFSNSVILLNDGSLYHYQYLVAADGANSMVYYQSGLSPIHKVFFIERDILKKDFDGQKDLSFYSFQHRALGWSFPKKEYFNVGLGFPYPKEVNALAIAEDFYQTLSIPNFKDYSKKGATLPNKTILKKPYYKKNVLFVGDAGCFSEPLTGEGIYQALYSGKMAAQAIYEKGTVVKKYTQLTKTLRQSKKIMLSFQNLFYRKNDFILKEFKIKQSHIQRMVDYHIGKRDLKYENFLSFYLSFHFHDKK